MPLIRQYLRIALRWRYVIIGAIARLPAARPDRDAADDAEIYRRRRRSRSRAKSNKVTTSRASSARPASPTRNSTRPNTACCGRARCPSGSRPQLRLVDDPKFFEMFGYTSKRPAFQLTNGRYPASGRSDAAAGRRRDPAATISPSLRRACRAWSTSRFTSPDAAFSARVANAWADEFHPDQSGAQGSGDLLRPQLPRSASSSSYRQRLEESQRQLVALCLGAADHQPARAVQAATGRPTVRALDRRRRSRRAQRRAVAGDRRPDPGRGALRSRRAAGAVDRGAAQPRDQQPAPAPRRTRGRISAADGPVRARTIRRRRRSSRRSTSSTDRSRARKAASSGSIAGRLSRGAASASRRCRPRSTS